MEFLEGAIVGGIWVWGIFVTKERIRKAREALDEQENGWRRRAMPRPDGQ